MPGMYWVTGATAAAVTAQFDAIELVEAGSGLLKINRVCLWQTTDLGDAQEEVLRVEWVRGHATTGSGGQTTVVTASNSSQAAAITTAKLLNTTIASTGTPLSLAPMGWNIRIPLDILYPPGMEMLVRNGERIVFRVAAPADSITVNASCLIEEF
jgi:hypothetical protein